MTHQRRKRKKTRVNDTAQARALASLKVVLLSRALRTQWKSLDKIERGERLRVLAGLGCSTRGLEHALGQSATSIRRHIELACLPPGFRDAIKAGASAKKILARKAVANRARQSLKRVLADEDTGNLSDEVADLITRFCRAEEQPLETPVLKTEISRFLGSVAAYLSTFEVSGRRFPRIPKRLGITALFKATCPEVVADQFWMEHQAEWLANIIWIRSPERPIWERAIQKAKALAKTSEPDKSIADLYAERELRLSLRHLSPARRRY